MKETLRSRKLGIVRYMSRAAATGGARSGRQISELPKKPEYQRPEEKGSGWVGEDQTPCSRALWST
jgi:hypothetical protein